MGGCAIPTGAHDITPEWLSCALGKDVTTVDKQQIGTGQIASSIRLKLDYAGEPGPPTLVAKVTSDDETSRQAALATRTYEVEVGFYSELADQLAVRRPACHWAGFDPARAAYGLLLEDLAPAEQGDQIKGCTVDEAAQAIDELALLHGPLWSQPLEGRYTWLDVGGGTARPTVGAFVAMLLPTFLERYEGRLDADVVELMQRVLPRYAESATPDAPSTVIHCDYRVDNLMFGGPRVCVLDWQTVSIGHGLSDVSYFLGGSLLPDDRRQHERELLDRYRTKLAEQGVELSHDDAWSQYRHCAFAGMNMAIVASMLVGRTDRGDDMFLAMAERAGFHALDLDTEQLLFA